MKLPYEDSIVYLFDRINPEPWTSPSASLGRKDNKFHIRFRAEEQMITYQRALRAAIESDGPINFGEMDLELHLFFWRQVARGTTGERNTNANYADVTNLQKSTEDALQGLLFRNDRQIRTCRSLLAAQGPDVDSRVAILVRPFSTFTEEETAFLGWANDVMEDAQPGDFGKANILPTNRGTVF